MFWQQIIAYDIGEWESMSYCKSIAVWSSRRVVHWILLQAIANFCRFKYESMMWVALHLSRLGSENKTYTTVSK